MTPDHDSVSPAIHSLLHRLAHFLERQPELRQDLTILARAAVHWLEQDRADSPTTVYEHTPPPRYPTSTAPMGGTLDRPPHDDWNLVPLDMLIARCKVKGDAARLMARRLGQKPLDGLDEVEIRHRASQLPDCPLWMLSDTPFISAPRVWEDLAGAFQAAGLAAEMIAVWSDLPDSLRTQHANEILALAAESQSLLMYAVADTRTVRQDFEQIQLFVRVREATRTERVFLSRFMKREDRADPATWQSLCNRIQDATNHLRTYSTDDKNRHKNLNNLKFKLRKMLTDPSATEEWPRVAELLANLGGEAALHDEEAQNLLTAVRQKHPETGEGNRPQEPNPEDLAEIQKAAQLLQGREAVYVGSNVTLKERADLVKAFRLVNVRGVTLTDEGGLTLCQREIEHPAVALVFLDRTPTPEWNARIEEICGLYDTPLVACKGTGNLAMVAREIVRIAGEKLRAG